MMAASPKFKIHINKLMVKITNSFALIKLNTQMATEPLINQSKNARLGTKDASKYIEVINDIAVI